MEKNPFILRRDFFYLYICHSIIITHLKIKIMSENKNEAAEQPQLTFGQKAVGLSFNPSHLPEVDKLKNSVADAIDLLHELREKTESTEVKAETTLAIRS